MHIRAQLQMTTTKEFTKFVSGLNSDGTADKFILENFDGSYRVDARSLLGVIYMMSEYGDDGVYLVNLTRDGEFPSCVDFYRA